MDIGTAVNNLDAAINTISLLRETGERFDEVELNTQLTDAYAKLASAKMALADTSGELDQDCQKAECGGARFSLCDQVMAFEGAWYRKDKCGCPRGMPFCPQCYDSDGHLVLTRRVSEEGLLVCFCPKCKTNHRNQVFHE